MTGHGRLILVISPHLDDAALSCGGSIAARVSDGDEVVVATVMSGGHEERALEDRRAMRLLGATALHLGVLDAPFRAARYRSFREIVFGDDELPRDDTADVEAALRPLVASRPDAVWAPLGVGGHIDHRLCFAAVSALTGDHGSVSYYEDRPYALVDDLVAIRFLEQDQKEDQETPGEVERTSPDPGPARRAAASFLRRYMVDEDDRAFSEARLVEARRRLSAGDLAATTRRLGGSTLVRHVTPLGTAEQRALVAAISAYTSQLPALFGADAGIAALYGDALTYEARWVRR